MHGGFPQIRRRDITAAADMKRCGSAAIFYRITAAADMRRYGSTANFLSYYRNGEYEIRPVVLRKKQFDMEGKNENSST